MGNHTATTNINLGGNWLSGDGGSEGVYVDNSGNIGIGTTSPNSKLHINGPITTATATKTANYTLTDSDSVIFVDATSGAVTITLPAASTSTIGRVYYIYKVDSSANAVDIVPNVSDTTIQLTSLITSQGYYSRVIGYTSTSWILN